MKSLTSTQQIGKDDTNAWHYDKKTALMDLTRGSTTSTNITLKTTTYPIRVSTEKTALLIIDMQNFFLHPALRRQAGSQEPTLGEIAASTLLETGIPAARLHGIRVIWLNWGLTEQDLNTMPPGVLRTFGSFPMPSPESNVSLSSKPGMVRVKNPALYKGLGVELGAVDIGHGKNVQGGKILMRDFWNTGIYGPLEEEFRRHCHISDSESDDKKKDVLIYKNRMSGLSGRESDLENLLRREGITLLLLAGVNTDQCVGSTLMDAYNKGFDCVLLCDGTATGSPFGAREAWEWNVTNCFGFVSTCEALKESSAQF
ncbi:uncharacterized protein N7483_011897 [Penicillium malachiteum]|uniref:uncharacterized protein n=1 Tax=Penicillium malachiteum TaxID=1324776 RepID=UPI002548BD70|nr:uncharacterized protein N7483_011897 [Penicillium malachiteum]KAJ5714716.1 hypothetical protein N7483_011897 [Penicillium malachiteum]